MCAGEHGSPPTLPEGRVRWHKPSIYLLGIIRHMYVYTCEVRARTDPIMQYIYIVFTRICSRMQNQRFVYVCFLWCRVFVVSIDVCSPYPSCPSSVREPALWLRTIHWYFTLMVKPVVCRDGRSKGTERFPGGKSTIRFHIRHQGPHTYTLSNKFDEKLDRRISQIHFLNGYFFGQHDIFWFADQEQRDTQYTSTHVVADVPIFVCIRLDAYTQRQRRKILKTIN